MNEHEDTGCGEYADAAAELALGVLTGRERAGALAHLDHSDAYRETVRQLTITAEQLLELLPALEPPAGFETRVLARLGITVPGLPPPALPPAPAAVPGGTANEPGAPGNRARRARRTLATMATAVAALAAALGGWGLHPATSPAPQAPLRAAALLSSTRQDIGQIYYYNSGKQWVYMAVDMPSGDGTVTCELEGPGGHYTAIGTFRLTHGHGAWGSPAQWPPGQLTGARLLAPNGTVLATATF
jgi:hypothetical protein